MLRILVVLLTFLSAVLCQLEKPVDYSGHKVLRVYPTCEEDLAFLHSLRKDYGVDLWNEPRIVDVPVMIRLAPDLVDTVIKALEKNGIRFEVAIRDVQRAIAAERIQNSATNYSGNAVAFDFGKYHQYAEIVTFIKNLVAAYPNVATLETAGNSFENRPIHVVKVTRGQSANKPVILIECGIHAREWSSVAAGLYLLNELVTKSGTDPVITTLLDKYAIYIINEANPDGYVYTWTNDRLWRKTRSFSSIDWSGCRGADANRNFDIEHCGVGTSRKPCDEIYCGDAPFSESESRAIRNLVNKHSSNMKAYFSVHAFSQLWMTPYGTTKNLPPNYSELVRVATAGTNALSKKYGTQYKVGSIANIIYEAAGSSVDYIYVKQGVQMSFALELRDTGRYGFFLPAHLILPTCEETTDGLLAAILALQ